MNSLNTGGRPRQFDEQTILARIMNLFQKNGYENTTFEQMVAESGLSRSSLYNTFGGKKKLMERAMKMYLETEAEQFNQQLRDEESGVDTLKSLIENFSKPSNKGCRDCLVKKTLQQNAASGEPPVQVAAIKKCLTKLWEAMTLAVSRARNSSKSVKKKKSVLTDDERAAIVIGLIQGTAVIARTGKQTELLQSIRSGAEKLLQSE